MRRFACVPGVVLAPLAVCAQGTAFTYQGRLSDGAAPANGLYDFQLTIFDSSDGSNLIAGPITNNSVDVSNDLCSATVDFGASVFTGRDADNETTSIENRSLHGTKDIF